MTWADKSQIHLSDEKKNNEKTSKLRIQIKGLELME